MAPEKKEGFDSMMERLKSKIAAEKEAKKLRDAGGTAPAAPEAKKEEVVAVVTPPPAPEVVKAPEAPAPVVTPAAPEVKAETPSTPVPPVEEASSEAPAAKKRTRRTSATAETAATATTDVVTEPAKTVEPETTKVSREPLLATPTPTPTTGTLEGLISGMVAGAIANGVKSAMEGVPLRKMVRRTFSKAGIITSTDGGDVEMMEVPVFSGPTSTVSVAAGRTVNLGDYNSLKLDVFCSVPCNLGEETAAFEYAKKFVLDKVSEEIKALGK